jgi:omega-hydroxy-beta-dihydromenaquinone-9 sulfotransferase
MTRGTPATPRATRKYERSAPLWAGCDLFAWVRLLQRNRFAIGRSGWRAALAITAASFLHTVLRFVQDAVHGRRIARTRIQHAPIFLLGHWRSGTTLLHELLACDPRLCAPTTYECFAPHHFLISDPWFPRLFSKLIPSRRPMDAMAAGWDHPQEDEFALCLMGQPSAYERIAFPARPQAGKGALDLRGLSPPQIREWKQSFRRLVQTLTYKNRGRRLILKSPPHTCRIPTLLELFPDALFIHLVRDPYVLYPSTLHLWRVLFTTHGLQAWSWEDLPDHVLQTFVQLHERLEEGKRLIPPGRFHELRYEDLVRDPISELEEIYRRLGLGDFEPARRPVEERLAASKEYQTNRYLLTVEEQRMITRLWGDVIRRQGYTIREEV